MLLLFPVQILILFISTITTFKLGTICSAGQYFDSTILDCSNCPSTMIANSNSKNNLNLDDGCTCNVDSYLVYSNITLTTSTNIYQNVQCQQCPEGSASSLDRSRCILCPKTSISNSTIGIVNPNTFECDCPDGSAIIEKDASGNYLNQKVCQICPNGTAIGASPIYQCSYCGDGKVYDKSQSPWACTCDLTNYVKAGNDCIPISEAQFIITNYPVNIAKSLIFLNEETLDKNVDGSLTIANSDTIEYLYLKAGYDCLKTSKIESCQTLANLCVLQLYDLNNPICKLYQYINNLKPYVLNSE